MESGSDGAGPGTPVPRRLLVEYLVYAKGQPDSSGRKFRLLPEQTLGAFESLFAAEIARQRNVPRQAVAAAISGGSVLLLAGKDGSAGAVTVDDLFRAGTGIHTGNHSMVEALSPEKRTEPARTLWIMHVVHECVTQLASSGAGPSSADVERGGNCSAML